MTTRRQIGPLNQSDRESVVDLPSSSMLAREARDN